MKLDNCKSLFLALAVLALFAGSAFAGDSDTQSVTVTVNAINEMDVAGGSVTLTIDAAVAGSNPTDPADNSSTHLDWTSNETGKKITVASDKDSPLYTLKVVGSVTEGDGSASAQRTLDVANGAMDFITGVDTETGAATLTYSASATAAAGVGSDVHTVTYTIADAS